MTVRFTLVTTAVVIALGLAPAAEAKVCVRIDAPRTVRVGSTFTASLTTMLPTWSGSRVVDLEPVELTGRPLRLTLRGPDGVIREIRLRRTREAAVWKARLRLAEPGMWRLSASGWEYAPRSCAPSVAVRVR